MLNQNKRTLSNQKTPGLIRKVSNLERVYFWTPYSNVSLMTRIKGEIEPEKLINALNIVQKKHPLLRAKIEFDEGNNAYFSVNNVQKTNFKQVNRISETQWLEELQNEITIPFDLEKESLIRFILVHSPQISELIIICNHSICDGMALTYLVRDLLNIYQNPTQEVEMVFPVDVLDFLPKKRFSVKSTMMRLLIAHANRKWEKEKYNFRFEDGAAVQNTYWDQNIFKTVFLELEPSETEELLDKCRNNEVTIGSAITAAFLASYQELKGPFRKNQKQIWIPFDLRRHFSGKIGDVFCLCVGAPRFSYGYDSKNSFWDNVSILNRKIQKRVKKLDSDALEVQYFDPNLLDALSTFAPFENIVPEAYTHTENLLNFSKNKNNIAFSFAKKSESMVPGTIPSNLGNLNMPEVYGDLNIDGMAFFPVMSNSVPLTIGGVTIANKLVFSLIYPESKEDDGSKTREMIQIRNKALKHLGFSEKVQGNIIDYTE